MKFGKMRWLNTTLLTAILLIILSSITFVTSIPTASAAVSSVCPNTYTFDTNQNIPYCSNKTLGTIDNAVTRLVISVHGIDRTGQLQLDTHTDIINKLNISNSVAIIAPQFLLEEDVDTFNLGNDILFWDSRWVIGSITGDTKANSSLNVSSYSVLDALIEDALQNFPNTTELVIIGHSAGGQFANRYAATNLIHDTVASQTLSIRYIVVNPSSYVYFDEKRVVANTLDQFAVPSAGEISNCTWYNEYRYGLENLNTYASQTGASQIRAQYPQRRVIYMVGLNDNDPNDPGLSVTCASMLQGSQRHERAVIYYNHLQDTFGGSITNLHTLMQVPNAGHSTAQTYPSDCGLEAIYDVNVNGSNCQYAEAMVNAPTNLDSTPEPVTTAPIAPTVSWDHDGVATNSYWVSVTPPGGTAVWTEFGTGICSGGSCSTALPSSLFTSNGEYVWNVCATGSADTTCAAQPQTITVNISAPSTRVVTASGSFNTAPLDISYGWDHDDVSTWFNLVVEFDQGGGNFVSVYNGWHSAADACNSPCSVTPAISYQNGNYRASMASYSEFFGTGSFGAYDTFTIDIPVSLATNIRFDGALSPTITAPPVDPVITWDHDGVTEWYNIWMGGPNTITSGWFAASDFSCNSTCTLNTPVNGGPAYVNGAYSFWIQGWNAVTGTGEWVSSDLTVAIAAPTVPVVSPNLTDEDRPVFTWDYDDITEWFNIYVGGEGRTVISGWFPASDFSCNSICTINLPAGITLWDGDYSLWMQLYSLGGTSAWVNPSNFTVDALDMYVGSAGPDPAVTFDYDGVTEWFNIYVGGPNVTYPTTWVAAADLNCASTCTLVTDNDLYVNGNYQVWMQGWSTINGTSGWMSHDFVYPIPAP